MIKMITQLVTTNDEENTFFEITYGDFGCEVVHRNGEFSCLFYQDETIYQIPLQEFIDALNQGKNLLQEL